MENANVQFGLVPFASVLALLFAWYFYAQLKKTSEGTPRMVYIADAVRKGAMSYLRQQYKVVALFFSMGLYGISGDRFDFRCRRCVGFAYWQTEHGLCTCSVHGQCRRRMGQCQKIR